MADVEQRTHQHQPIRILGEATIAGFGVAPQPLDMQKRMLNGRSHCALAPILQFLCIRQRSSPVRPLIGEVARSGGKGFNDGLLPPIAPCVRLVVASTSRRIDRLGSTFNATKYLLNRA